MPENSTNLDIATRLDQSSMTQLYWSLAIMATIGGFLFGYDTSNIGSALTFIPYHLGSLALGYLVAGASLGAALGAILAGPLTDAWGRKSLLVADAAIYALGAVLSAVTVDAAMLLIARTLIGVAVGADSAIATSYIAELAPKDRRGRLSILQQWMVTMGIFIAYVVAIVVFRALPRQAGSFDWRLILGLGAVPALVGLVFRTRMPESPRWLLSRRRFTALQKTLERLGIPVSLADIERTAAAAPPADRRRERLSPAVKKALVIASLFMIFQQVTGINVPFYYGPKILEPLFGGVHRGLLTTTVTGIEATAVLAVINVAATYIGFRNIDRAGRRTLSRLGYGGMALFMLLSAGALIALRATPQILVLLLSLAGFIVFFAFGVGGTGWIIQGEYFPTEVRGRLASVTALFDWLANFAVVELFPLMDKSWGLATVMLVFAGLAVLAVVFVSGWMPETKGVSLEEMTALFEDHGVRSSAT